MITLTYKIAPEEKKAELEWLKSQMIFPAVEDSWDWVTQSAVINIGVIVDQHQALAIKLRHKLQTQDEYNQRGFK